MSKKKIWVDETNSVFRFLEGPLEDDDADTELPEFQLNPIDTSDARVGALPTWGASWIPSSLLEDDE